MIHRCRVVKVGGSLFTQDDCAARLCKWLKDQTPMHSVVVAGGGVWADAVRRLDQQYGLPTTTAHWMAIRAMSVTSWLLACSEAEFQYVDRFSTLFHQLSQPQPAHLVFDTLDFLQYEEPHQHGLPLPHGWHVTSDSIAARLVHVLGASELVLLKSTSARASGFARASLDQARSDGLVDDYFPTAAAGIDGVRIEQLA